MYSNDEIIELIKKKEFNTFEAKLYFKGLNYKNTRAIASLMNTSGGKLIIGLEDKGEKDFHISGLIIKGSKDAFKQSVFTIIENDLGREAPSLCTAEFMYLTDPKGIITGEGEILILDIKKSEIPIFHLKSNFFYRRNEETIRINTSKEIVEYVRDHFNYFRDKNEKYINDYINNLVGLTKMKKILLKQNKHIFTPLYSIAILFCLIGFITFLFHPLGFVIISIGFIYFTTLMIIWSVKYIKHIKTVSTKLLKAEKKLKEKKDLHKYEKIKKKTIISNLKRVNVSRIRLFMLYSANICLILISFGLLLPIFCGNIMNLLAFIIFSIFSLVSYYFLHIRAKGIYKSDAGFGEK